MGLFGKLFGKSSSKTSGGLAVVIGSCYTPPQEMVQRLSSDGHFDGCSSVSGIEDPVGWTSHEDYEDKAIAGIFVTARRKGFDTSNCEIVTQHGSFPRFGGNFFVVRLVPK